jgi:predicted pyridoxine 5'-phosphate oxidase superfamily flavin-nucleotide-binding protein
MKPSEHIAFTPAVQQLQSARGSRSAYARVAAQGGFEREVDGTLRAVLAEIDTAFVATATADGQPYVQHRGGPKGFIRALDEHTLAFVEQPGNRQYISMGNLSENNRVCVIAIDYAQRRRVKIWGTARIVAQDGVELFVIEVAQWDLNCPKHIPTKLDAADVAQGVRALQDRVQQLEAENAALRAQLAHAV